MRTRLIVAIVPENRIKWPLNTQQIREDASNKTCLIVSIKRRDSWAVMER
jgi:hypothetical protein